MKKFYISLAALIITILALNSNVKSNIKIVGEPTNYIMTLTTKYNTPDGKRYKDDTVETFYIKEGMKFKEKYDKYSNWVIAEEDTVNNIINIIDINEKQVIFNSYNNAVDYETGESKRFVVLGEETTINSLYLMDTFRGYRSYTIKVDKVR